MKNLILLVAFSVVFNLQAFAQESAAPEMEMVVVDQNFNSSDRIVIDQETIKRSRATNLAQILSSQANIVISSTNFQPNSVFVRGGDSSHVLFVIDGVPTYDASTLQKTVNLSGLNVTNIKRIEVLKGSQSVLYGGQALSAVIKIFTIPDEFKNAGKVIVQGGVDRAETAVGADHLVSDKLMISLGAKHKDEKNISPVKDSTEKYQQTTSTADLALAYKLDPQTRAIIKLSLLQDENYVPTTTGVDVKAVDTKDFKFGTTNFGTTAIFTKVDLINVSVSLQKSGRQLFQEAKNSPTNSKTDYDYEGHLLNTRAEIILPKNNVFSGLIGTSLAHESYEEKDLTNGNKVSASNQYQGTFVKFGVQAVPETMLLEAGYRREEGFDAYQTGLTLWKNIKLEYSTGFKAPSLSQLYSPFYGNPDLKPEQSKTVNLTYEAKMTDHFLTSVSIFDSNYKNLFVNVGGQYQNVATSRTKGAELAASFTDQDLGMNYQVFLAYQEPYDSSTSTWLVKRPLRSAGAKLTQFFSGDLASVTLEVNHVGERRDKQTVTNRYGTVEAYTVAHVAGNYKIADNSEVFARIDNVTNKKYEQNYGYFDSGLKGRIGFQIGY